MPLPIRTDTELLNSQVTAMQASAVTVLDFSVGSDYRAIIESNMGNSLWLQALISALLSVTRLLTCSGNDVDTFVGDFGLKRKPATPAFGNVTFSRFTTGTIVNVKIGVNVLSRGNGVSYLVVEDTTNPNWDISSKSYIFQTSTSSITIPVIATTNGVIGNCLSNQITTISGVLPGVDTVTNAQPFTNGQNAQSDQSLKDEFILYLASLSRAVKQAIQYAVSIVPGVARYIVVENKTIGNVTQLGFFYVVVDDGTGNASSQLISNVSSSVEAYRGLTIQYAVYPPTPFPISITAHVFNGNPDNAAAIEANVIAALENYITSQTFDSLFSYSRIPAIIYDVDTDISDVTNYTLNGGTSDIQISGAQIMTVGTITIIMNA